MGIHLGGARIGVIVLEMQTGKFFGKFLFELRTIISQYELHWIRKDLDAELEKLRLGL